MLPCITPHLVEAASLPGAPAQAALDQMVAGGMSRDQALASLQRLIDQQAHMLGANDIFFASALIFVALIVPVWLPGRSRPMPAGARMQARRTERTCRTRLRGQTTVGVTAPSIARMAPVM